MFALDGVRPARSNSWEDIRVVISALPAADGLKKFASEGTGPAAERACAVDPFIVSFACSA